MNGHIIRNGLAIGNWELVPIYIGSDGPAAALPDELFPKWKQLPPRAVHGKTVAPCVHPHAVRIRTKPVTRMDRAAACRRGVVFARICYMFRGADEKPFPFARQRGSSPFARQRDSSPFAQQRGPSPFARQRLRGDTPRLGPCAIYVAGILGRVPSFEFTSSRYEPQSSNKNRPPAIRFSIPEYPH
jgi:hypothetical protein